MKYGIWTTHDANARNDLKTVALIQRFGLEGYGRWWVLVEIMLEQDGYGITLDDPTLDAIALQMHCSRESLDEFLDYAIALGLVVKNDLHLFSQSLIRRLKRRESVCQARRAAAQVRWKTQQSQDVHANALQTRTHVNANAMQTDARVEKSRVEKSRSTPLLRTPLAKKPLPPGFDSPEVKAALDTWLKHKSERGETYKPTGLAKLISKWSALGAERFIAAVDNSISQNYQGLYEPKAGDNGTKSGLEQRLQKIRTIGQQLQLEETYGKK